MEQRRSSVSDFMVGAGEEELKSGELSEIALLQFIFPYYPSDFVFDFNAS